MGIACFIRLYVNLIASDIDNVSENKTVYVSNSLGKRNTLNVYLQLNRFAEAVYFSKCMRYMIQNYTLVPDHMCI